jgi:hypothetical protein
MGQAHPGAGIAGVKQIVGLSMTGQDVLKGRDGRREILKAGRHTSLQISSQKQDIGFIKCDPVMDILQAEDHSFCEGHEFGNGRLLMPWIVLKVPSWVSEVMKGQHGFDGMVSQEINNPLVMVDGIGVPFVLFRLDPAPFQGEAVSIDPQGFKQMEILFAELIMMGHQRLGFEGRVP